MPAVTAGSSAVSGLFPWRVPHLVPGVPGHGTLSLGMEERGFSSVALPAGREGSPPSLELHVRLQNQELALEGSRGRTGPGRGR